MEYTIKHNGAELSARTLGGELLSYKKDVKEYVWTGDENFWTGHAPGLFPFVSSLKDGKVEIAGEMYYSKPKHGFLRTSEMKLVEKTETSMTFELHDTVFNAEDSIEKVATLVKAYMEYGGHQLQINSVNSEKMKEAQKHPEDYPELIVRVWGWSGHFVEMPKCYQDQINQRQEFGV